MVGVLDDTGGVSVGGGDLQFAAGFENAVPLLERLRVVVQVGEETVRVDPVYRLVCEREIVGRRGDVSLRRRPEVDGEVRLERVAARSEIELDWFAGIESGILVVSSVYVLDVQDDRVPSGRLRGKCYYQLRSVRVVTRGRSRDPTTLTRRTPSKSFRCPKWSPIAEVTEAVLDVVAGIEFVHLVSLDIAAVSFDRGPRYGHELRQAEAGRVRVDLE